MHLINENTQKKLNKWLLKSGWFAPVNTQEEIEMGRLLKQLTFFSVTILIFSILFFRFSLNSITTFLLRSYSINFIYRPFDVSFSTTDGYMWPFERIFFVFGLGYFIFTIIGIIGLKTAQAINKVNWKIILVISWLSLIFVNSIPAAIVASIFSTNSFGLIIRWLAPDIIIRVLLGLGSVLMMYLSRNLWIYLFLKASPSSIFLTEDEPMNLYIQHVFCKSWVYGFLILLLFNWPAFDLFWPIFLLSLGFIIRPFFKGHIWDEDIYIKKSNKKVFSSQNSIYYLIGLLVLIRIAGSVLTIDF